MKHQLTTAESLVRSAAALVPHFRDVRPLLTIALLLLEMEDA